MKKIIYVFVLIAAILFSHSQTFAQEANAFPNSTFGIDIGVGSMMFKEQIPPGFLSDRIIDIKHNAPVFAVGFRYLYRFNPYIGADFLKVNFICPFRAQRDDYLMTFQFLTGIRGNTPTFFKSMSGFAAVRMGYSLKLIEPIMHGFALETEIGLNLTRMFFIAFSYNLTSLFVDNFIYYYDKFGYLLYYSEYSTSVNLNTYALRIGFNF